MNGIADTSFFIAVEQRRPDLSNVPDDLGVSVVTLGELHLGVLTASSSARRNQRLATLTRARDIFEAVPIGTGVADAWARLTEDLRRRRRRAPVNDIWIAATAVTLSVPVVTQDDDYDPIDEVEVIKV